MRNIFGLIVGALLILTALLLAAKTSREDSSPRPEAAVQLATALRQTPTLPPPTRTPAATPLPTITPIQGWTRHTSLALGDILPAVELWLPASFVGGDMFQEQERTLAQLGKVGEVLPRMSVATRNESSGYLEAGYASGMTVFFAADSTTDYDSSARVRVVNLSRFNSKNVEFVNDDYFTFYRTMGAWVPVSLGRYAAAKLELAGDTSWGASIRKIEYRIDAPGSSWIIVYTSRESDWQRNLPIFVKSAESFSIRPSP